MGHHHLEGRTQHLILTEDYSMRTICWGFTFTATMNLLPANYCMTMWLTLLCKNHMSNSQTSKCDTIHNSTDTVYVSVSYTKKTASQWRNDCVTCGHRHRSCHPAEIWITRLVVIQTSLILLFWLVDVELIETISYRLGLLINCGYGLILFLIDHFDHLNFENNG